MKSVIFNYLKCHNNSVQKNKINKFIPKSSPQPAFEFHNKVFNSQQPHTNPKLGGGNWSPQEIAHKQALLEVHSLLNESKDPKAMYQKFQKHFRAVLPQEDRIKFLRIIEGRSGIKFKIGENPSEEQLLHLLFNKPLIKTQQKTFDFSKAK
jgi:hypothetical protein